MIQLILGQLAKFCDRRIYDIKISELQAWRWLECLFLWARILGLLLKQVCKFIDSQHNAWLSCNWRLIYTRCWEICAELAKMLFRMLQLHPHKLALSILSFPWIRMPCLKICFISAPFLVFPQRYRTFLSEYRYQHGEAKPSRAPLHIQAGKEVWRKAWGNCFLLHLSSEDIW